MQVSVSRVGHVVVDDNVDAFDVDTATDDIRGNHDSLVEILEGLVSGDAFLLGQTGVDADGWEVAFVEKAVEFVGPCNGLDEDDHLVELQGI